MTKTDDFWLFFFFLFKFSVTNFFFFFKDFSSKFVWHKNFEGVLDIA